jgi:predicted NBD/HSP70 family sugar kinase
MGCLALVADLGGTKIAVARADDSGRVTHRLQAPTPPAGGLAVVESIAGLMHRLATKGAGGRGIGVPGLAYPVGAVWAPKIRGWERRPLGELPRVRFDMPVLVDSDRNA